MHIESLLIVAKGTIVENNHVIFIIRGREQVAEFSTGTHQSFEDTLFSRRVLGIETEGSLMALRNKWFAVFIDPSPITY